MSILPDATEFGRLCRTASVVPVHREILADMDTPVSAYLKVADGSHSFLLESLEGGEKWARFSFIGTGPRLLFASRGHSVEVRRNGEAERFEAADPIEALRSVLAGFRPAEVEGLPRLWAGAVGYLAYDMVRFMERLPETKPDELGLPECMLMVPETLIVFDNLRQTARIIRNVFPAEGDEPAALYRAACQGLEETVARLRARRLPARRGGHSPEPPAEPTSNMTRERFCEMVEAAKRYIRQGDAIQVVLSQRFEADYGGEPFDVYRALRLINPSPYMFYLDFGPEKLVGSSPEVLVRLEGERVELRPIAGTRPRGGNEEEDRRLQQELMTDPKEAAEHIMLVDLGRNDVGRVSRYGTVEVNELMVVERYSHVMHIVSNVRGRLAPGKDALDVLRACFPAGTVSGAPKVRAMEIIEELEPCRRGPYAGAVGYFDFSGNMDLCITIRTLLLREGKVWVQAGAGIVADSEPEREYQETINKARGMMSALSLAATLGEAGQGPQED